MVLLNQRAGLAQRLVLDRFVQPFAHLPGTRLGRAAIITGDGAGAVRLSGREPFNYWWQAHLVDAIVDAAQRSHRTGDSGTARRLATLGHRVLATVWLRNGLTLRNHFYDDMAWLVLAVGRLAALDQHLGLTAHQLSLTPARRILTRQLLQGCDPTGGVVWNKDRDFLNVPAAGPVALHLARTGRTPEARTVVEWILRELSETTRGLVRDGVRRGGRIVEDAYTYNQGTTLGVLLELGEPYDLERAAALVRAVAEHMTQPSGMPGVLVTHGGGDGGLFTGILARYLALAARHPGLERDARDVAARMVRATGAALWEGRDPTTGAFPASTTVSITPSEAAARCELSTQLQAWMVMEAAAVLGSHGS